MLGVDGGTGTHPGSSFPAAPHGALYLLIYFPDCALTSLKLRLHSPCSGSWQAEVLSLCHLGAVKGKRAACPI